jgi:phage FluMu gp28-like protein
VKNKTQEALIPFWSFQRELIADPARLVLVNWARGNGKSFVIAAKIVLEAFDNEARKKPSDWLIVSATKEQAKEALEKAKDFTRAIYAIAEEMEILEESVTTPDGKERYTLYRLLVGKRTKMLAMSGSPRAVSSTTTKKCTRLSSTALAVN